MSYEWYKVVTAEICRALLSWDRAQTPPSQPFALCRHIAGWTQACN